MSTLANQMKLKRLLAACCIALAAPSGEIERRGDFNSGAFALDPYREDDDCNRRVAPFERGKHIPQCGSIP